MSRMGVGGWAAMHALWPGIFLVASPVVRASSVVSVSSWYLPPCMLQLTVLVLVIIVVVVVGVVIVVV